MHILSVGTAVPEHRHSQEELMAKLGEVWGHRASDDLKKLRRLASSTKVETRHLSMTPAEYLTKSSFTERTAVFKDVGLRLGEQAIRMALDEAGLKPTDVDMIFFTTVTGIAVPTLDAKLCNKLGFRPDIKRIPVFGLGCVAGAAGTARLHDYLKAYPGQVALLLSVELCTLTFQLDDMSPSNMVGVLLFGDGASALVGVGNDHPKATSRGAIETLAVRSRFFADTEQIMGWDVGTHGFRIVLDPGVPEIVRAHLRQDLSAFLTEQNLSLADIKSWVSHPGGPKVLQAIQEVMELDDEALRLSWNELRDYGNLSSSSVLFILRDTMQHRRPPPGSLGVMMAMGPGFCAEQVLLKW